MCDKVNLPGRSSLNDKGYQLADFAKKLSFSSYSLFSLLQGQDSHFQSLKLPRGKYLRALRVGKWSSTQKALNSVPSVLHFSAFISKAVVDRVGIPKCKFMMIGLMEPLLFSLA